MYDIFNQIKADTNAFLKEADEFVERQKQYDNQLKTNNNERKTKKDVARLR